MPIQLNLFLTFAKIGLFTFGGGYAMLPMIEHDCVERKQWITHDEMMNVTVIAESTPGPISINCATFVGYKQGGLTGAIAATFGVVLPSFVVIYLISMFLDNLLEIPLIANAFRGIQAAVGILILEAALKMIKLMDRTLLSGLIGAGSLIAMVLIDLFAWNFSSISLMLIAAAVSLAVFAVTKYRRQKGGEGK